MGVLAGDTGPHGASQVAVPTAPAVVAAPESRTNTLQYLVLALPVLLLAAKAWERRWMSDDGMINLRVVDHLLAGNGPVFNEGERVEAATSPLWIAMLAVGDLIAPLRLEWIAVTLGIALSLVGVAAAIAGSARLWRQAGDGFLVPVGALCLVVLSPVWDFSSSGLEGGLSFCWLGVSLLLLQRWAAAEQRGFVAVAVVVGLGPIIRPDFVVISTILVGVLVLGEWRASVRRRVSIVAVAVAIPAAYQLFRMAFFGALVPNTYFAKEGGESSWSQGWHYLRDFVGPYVLWVPLLGLGLTVIAPLVLRLRQQGADRAVLVALAFPLSGLASALAVVRGGGDFMHARMLLPSLFAIVAPAATVAIRRDTRLGLAALPWAAVCLVALGPPAVALDRLGEVQDHRAALHLMLAQDNLVTLEDFGLAPGGANHFEFDDDHRLYFGQTPLEIDGRPVPVVPGAPDRILLAYGVGAISYYAGTGTFVYDMLGLGDALTARLEIDRRGPLPGHEKALPAAWVWARFIDPSVPPDPTLFAPPGILQDVSPTLDDDLQPSQSPSEFAAEVEAAREALRCPDLADLTDSGNPLQNLAHALTAFRLRIPPRPTTALADLC